MNLQEWKKKNSQSRRYAHFDKKVCLRRIWKDISDPEKVAKHSFFPFIHFTAELTKYSKKRVKIPKKREIYYSAHVDRYIFQYYSYKLNEVYNEKVVSLGINNVAIAYRNNLHKNNIHFAKEAFDFIQASNKCFIVVGDFTDFFDSLSHKYLKARLCELLGVEKLSKDYYAVYKNVTKYAYWEMSSLLALNNLKNTRRDLKKLNNKNRVIEPEIYKANRKGNVISNPNKYGIPQGSSISAVLSNIYMIKFDVLIADYVQKRNGLYLRYSDDFIFIIPASEESDNKKHVGFLLTEVKKVDNLKLQQDKTQYFSFNVGNLQKCDKTLLPINDNSKSFLNYLGFTFDGRSVKIRDKTLSKYYYRMYRKIRGINRRNSRVPAKGRQTSLHRLYDKFSYKGSFGRDEKTKGKKSNFLTYVYRSSQIFENEPKIKNDIRRHMHKIRKRLK